MKKYLPIIVIAILSVLLTACDNTALSGEGAGSGKSIISGGITDGTASYGAGTPKYLYIDSCDGLGPRKKPILNQSEVFNAYATTLVPKRTGFVFKGFSLDELGKNLLSETETTILDNNSTLYAQWAPVSYGMYALDETTHIDRNLGVRMLPIQHTIDNISIMIPYHYKEVVIQYAFKSDQIAQTLYANASGRNTVDSYKFSMDIPVTARMPSIANLYNMDTLVVSYTATDYQKPFTAGQTTTVGYSVEFGGVLEYREALIAIK